MALSALKMQYVVDPAWKSALLSPEAQPVQAEHIPEGYGREKEERSRLGPDCASQTSLGASSLAVATVGFVRCTSHARFRTSVFLCRDKMWKTWQICTCRKFGLVEAALSLAEILITC